jgi:hypothetical protein
MKRLLKMGLADTEAPLSDREKQFIEDMKAAIADNPNFEPSYGQVVKLTDLHEKYII